jgi:hypothetical protein
VCQQLVGSFLAVSCSVVAKGGGHLEGGKRVEQIRLVDLVGQELRRQLGTCACPKAVQVAHSALSRPGHALLDLSTGTVWAAASIPGLSVAWCSYTLNIASTFLWRYLVPLHKWPLATIERNCRNGSCTTMANVERGDHTGRRATVVPRQHFSTNQWFGEVCALAQRGILAPRTEEPLHEDSFNSYQGAVCSGKFQLVPQQQQQAMQPSSLMGACR